MAKASKSGKKVLLTKANGEMAKYTEKASFSIKTVPFTQASSRMERPAGTVSSSIRKTTQATLGTGKMI